MRERKRVVLLGRKELQSRHEIRTRIFGLVLLALGVGLVILGGELWASVRAAARFATYMGVAFGCAGLGTFIYATAPWETSGDRYHDAPSRARGPLASSVLSVGECDPAVGVASGDELFARKTVYDGDIVGVFRMSPNRISLEVVNSDTIPEYAQSYRVLPAMTHGLFRLTLEKVAEGGRPPSLEANPFADLV
jgi:hypothetical protein